MNQPQATLSFDEIQAWVVELHRALAPDTYTDRQRISHSQLPFCLVHAIPGVEVIEVAPVVCLHAPHPNPGNLAVRTTWSFFARYQDRLFGPHGEVASDEAAAHVHDAGRRWLLPLQEGDYELRTPQRVMPIDEWQPMFGNLWDQYGSNMIESLRERVAIHAQAATLDATTAPVSPPSPPSPPRF